MHNESPSPWATRRSMTIAVAIVMLALWAAPARAHAATVPTVAPLNPAFVQYLQTLSRSRLTGEALPDGPLTPSPIDFGPLEGVRLGPAAADPPVRFDLRARGRVSPVKDQGQLGTCWAFAAIGSLESCLYPEVKLRFSEDNLVFGALAGEDDPYFRGGGPLTSIAYLARWQGPVAAAADAYGDNRTPAGLSPSRHVQEVLVLPPRSGPLGNEAIKWAIMKHGAVTVAMDMVDGICRSHAGHRTYYHAAPVGNGHEVDIVGWDDTFNAAWFGGPGAGLPQPPGDGAFVVRNSWGRSWGEHGYFHVSYYDVGFAEPPNVVYDNAEPVTNYRDIYQFDRFGWLTNFGYADETAWFANRFMCRSTGDLAAASFYSYSPGSSYQIFSGPSVDHLTADRSGTLAVTGYHTVKLKTPRRVTRGRRFVVAVRLTTPGYEFPIPVESPLPWISEGARASAGQSFVSPDGTEWSDLTFWSPNTNACLKAFVKAP